MSDVEIRVESIVGTCDAGFQPGERFYVRNKGFMALECARPMCLELLGAISSHCMAMATGGSFPWEDEEGSIRACCPDCLNLLTVSLRRVE